jgi:hypothetical protein
VFAWSLYFRRGGYCALRKSRHIAGWHWLWSPDLKRWLHYVPLEPKRDWLGACLHKFWYRGRIQRGDGVT